MSHSCVLVLIFNVLTSAHFLSPISCFLFPISGGAAAISALSEAKRVVSARSAAKRIKLGAWKRRS
jgi:hypothetical protein